MYVCILRILRNLRAEKRLLSGPFRLHGSKTQDFQIQDVFGARQVAALTELEVALDCNPFILSFPIRNSILD